MLDLEKKGSFHCLFSLLNRSQAVAQVLVGGDLALLEGLAGGVI